MDYYTVRFAPGQRLGISVIIRSTDDPRLGHTVVETCDSSGYAYANGVRSGDFVITVNGEYVAYLPHEQCVQRMQSIKHKSQQMVVEFCRPNPTEWNRIRNSENAVVCEGILQKQAGLLKRWTSRLYKLTREYLAYYHEDEEAKKKFAIESILLSRVYRPGSRLVELTVAGKEFLLEAEDEMTANRWKHALDCAIARAFDLDLPSKYRQVLQTPKRLPQLPESVSILGNTNAQKANDDNMDTSYLAIGREKHPRSATPTHINRNTGMRQFAANTNKNPYWMLLLCKLRIMNSPDDAVDTSNVPDPAKIEFPLLNYSFSLEDKILRERPSNEKSNDELKEVNS